MTIFQTFYSVVRNHQVQHHQVQCLPVQCHQIQRHQTKQPHRTLNRVQQHKGSPAHNPLTYLCRWFSGLLFCAVSICALANTTTKVNGVTLTTSDLQSLQQQGVTIPAGDYWYDCQSGLWGYRGGPSVGILHIPVAIHCEKLSATVSGSHTGVFINGREIHAQELAFLNRLYGYVTPGRYWLNRQGIGGIEGQPAAFDLNLAMQQQRSPSRPGLGHRWRGGSVIGDGEVNGFISSEVGGTSVTCGPDGGCIY